MPRSILVDLDQESLWHSQRGVGIILIAPWARRSGGAARTRIRSIPRLAGMGLTNPADILAEGAHCQIFGAFDHQAESDD
jgi:hypothetical protein